MKTSKAKAWEIAIRKARTHVLDYDKARWIIATLALEVCDITHGGKKDEDSAIYTVKRFAEAIEMNRKTLYEWVKAKRLVIDRLPKRQQKTAMSDFDYVTIKATELIIDSNDPPPKIWKTLHDVANRDPYVKRFVDYQRVLNAIIYNAQRPLLLKDVKQEFILPLIEKSELIANLLKKELEFREKFGKGADQKRLGVSSEVVKATLGTRLKAGAK